MLGLDKTSKQLRTALQAAGLLSGARGAGLDQHSDNMALVRQLCDIVLGPFLQKSHVSALHRHTIATRRVLCSTLYLAPVINEC